jgi:Protein of unknown function (DUF2855)
MASAVHVDKTHLANVQVVDQPLVSLEDGQLRLRIESFAVTSNNVTYAVIGDLFKYWNFFPAPEGMGIVPMWGHAVIEESRHPQFEAGERVYGYIPMATHLDVLPGKVDEAGFTDMSAHRQEMNSVYNRYSRIAADPEHDPARENQRMIFGPLFKTGFLIEAMFDNNGWNGAQSLVITSASSKTSLALASVARERSPQIRRVGLTAAVNADFVEATGLFHEVIAYGDISALPLVPSVSVDMAGNAAVRRAVHEVLGDNLKYSCLVGATHVDAREDGRTDPPPGPTPTLFFAPDWISALVKQLGPKGFTEAVAASWHQFLAQTDRIIRVETREGLAAAAEAFGQTLRGETYPAVGIVIRP